MEKNIKEKVKSTVKVVVDRAKNVTIDVVVNSEIALFIICFTAVALYSIYKF
ncbi:hypothetical protein GCM10023189_38020 [Nibrella saemangeumensis]|uniref:Uncharacterized protein n=1 Tax=Nibrella saemangeumensis TaxID=1084526 RepID=A0ABP8N9K4_9BACT